MIDPGETVNLSVDMQAPGKTGDFSGSWMLKAANGTVFGVGTQFNLPVTVNVKDCKSVPEPKDPNIVFDFVANYCEAKWRTNVGSIDCPSTALDYTNGSITRSFDPVLEGGFQEDEGTLITIPAKGNDGMIRGKFPVYKVKAGDFFAANLTCGNKKSGCSVTFELLYSLVGEDNLHSIGGWVKEYGDGTVKVYEDLSSLVGEQVNFYLVVSNDGNSTDDMALWVAPRITRP